MLLNPQFAARRCGPEGPKHRLGGFRNAVSGHRFYSPNLGRFINRDPIEEQGGINLYAFCRNDGVNKWDYLGMFDDYVIGMDGGSSFAHKLVWEWKNDHGDPDDFAETEEQAERAREERKAAADRLKLKEVQQKLNAGQSVTVVGANGQSQVFQPGDQIAQNPSGQVVAIAPSAAVAPNSTATTTVQILGRPVSGDPTGSLHTSILIQSGSESAVISGQPSRKLTGLDEILNVFGFDRGVVIQPQTPTSMQRSGEYQIYLAADQRNFLATYESPTVTLNRSFNDVMADVARFYQAVTNARVPYLASTQNSNSYTFTLATRLTGQTFNPSSNYQVPGSGTQLKIPPFD